MFDRLKNWLDSIEFDVCRWRYFAMAVSGLLCLIIAVLFVVPGPNWGTDFTGGTEIHLKFEEPLPIGELREGLRALDLEDDAVQSVNGEDSGEFIVRIADPTFGLDDLQKELEAALSGEYGPEWAEAIEGSVEVTARFLVKYTGDPIPYQQVARDLQDRFPGLTTAPGRSDREVAINVPGLADRVQQQIATQFVDHPFQVLSTDSVGPKAGAELRRNGFIAMVATLALIMVYVGFRFDLEYAPGAVVALLHDVWMTIGVFIVFQLEFNLATIGALLTILGYSINDTIVIYDRIRENRGKFRKSDMVSLINRSVSETFTRTLATSFTTLLAIVTFLVWGGPALRDFAVAMVCGIVFGGYSTVYIASPLVMIFEDLKPHFTRLIAVRDDDDDLPDLGGDGVPALTESEKRRRARAEAEKREQLG